MSDVYAVARVHMTEMDLNIQSYFSNNSHIFAANIRDVSYVYTCISEILFRLTEVYLGKPTSSQYFFKKTLTKRYDN